MSKLIYQPLGNNWAIGIESDNPKEIESQDFSWYNHGAYNGTLKFMSPRFAYIWSTEEKFHKYLYDSSLAILLGKYGNSLKEKVRRYARLLARMRFNGYKQECFIHKSNVPTYRHVPQEDSSGAKMSTTGYTNDEEEWKQNSGSYYVYDR
jgi:hypothetical protein